MNWGYLVKIDKKGRIVIPIEVRKELNLRPGLDVLMWIEKGKLSMRRNL